MKLTTKGRFAVTALLDMILAANANNLDNPQNIATPISLLNISKRQDISLSYLEQLFVKLRKSGIVKSYKGPGGGYIIAKNPNEITISNVINAVNDDMDARNCHGMVNCKNNKQKCLTHDLWSGLTEHIYNYLDNISLYDLLLQNTQSLYQSTPVKIIKFA